MTDQIKNSGVDNKPIVRNKQFMEQLSRGFAKKKPDTVHVISPKQKPKIKQIFDRTNDEQQKDIFQSILEDQTYHIQESRKSRYSRNFDNPQTNEVLVILPHQQQKNSTYRRISSKFNQQMECYHERQTLSKQKTVQSRLNFLIDQWFTYPEQQNKVTKGVPILIIKTIANILQLQVPQTIHQANRNSTVIINRDEII